ncbi:AAA family ATPase [Aureimonas sp. AU40]|uniref:AAA family ATPase n=1 Tax=Aureimonas sp. AU40 TaxID=1637747 RepID=UPI0009EC48FA|nr:AAA family ATPase [Aureimonas sp. AU40]
MTGRFGLRQLATVAGAILLTVWLFPALELALLAATITLAVAALLGLAHEHGLTSPLRSKAPMAADLLDQFTNRQALENLVSAAQVSELIDAAALTDTLKSKVVGQDGVIADVALTIRRRLAMERREKPVGVFCFAGPPGVGKTELGKQLAAALGRGYLFFDMSTCSQPEGASTLFGSPKGYMGSDSYGQLTSGLRDKPASLVLLDEFEKASPDVMRRFLTAWNDGFVTETSDGRKIATNRAMFVLTTNAAADRISDLAREITDRDGLASASKAALREGGFPPEVLSRIDQVFSFRPLEGLDVARVAVVQILAIVESYGLSVGNNGIDAELLFETMQRAGVLQAAGGVREIVRAIEDQIADVLIEAKAAGASSVRLIATRSERGELTADVERLS